jgi:FMN phosphatase YigB (HAD superfamily)
VKKLIIFDLDGTLAESKSSLDAEMSALLHDLLGVVKVAVISGGDWPQFEKQLLSVFSMTNVWSIYPSFLHVELSSSDMRGVGKRFIQKISPRMKKRKSWVLCGSRSEW